jgi:integrase
MTTGTIGNRTSFDRLPGGGYAFTMIDDAVRIELRHLRRESRQLHAEVDVQAEWAGVRRHKKSLSCADLNLSSQSARKPLAKHCGERARTKGDEFDWLGAIDAACIEAIRLVPSNIVADVETKPRRKRDKGDAARLHCWTADEARSFLDAAKAHSPQAAAFYALALDSGARKGELCGLRWADVDLEAGTIRLVQQLLKPGAKPVFGPLKAGRPRTITLAAETVRLIAVHKRQQAELKMANRQHYHDHGLVFAKEYRDLQNAGAMLGHPLQSNNLGQVEYAPADQGRESASDQVPRLAPHLRHVLLQAGEPVHVVSERLGHSTVTMTLEVYSHVLPNMQQRAAATIGAVLHG